MRDSQLKKIGTIAISLLLLAYVGYQVYKSTERERAGFRGEYAYILVLRSLAGYITNFYALDFDTDEAGRESFALYFGEGGGNYARYEGGASQ